MGQHRVGHGDAVEAVKELKRRDRGPCTARQCQPVRSLLKAGAWTASVSSSSPSSTAPPARAHLRRHPASPSTWSRAHFRRPPRPLETFPRAQWAARSRRLEGDERGIAASERRSPFPGSARPRHGRGRRRYVSDECSITARGPHRARAPNKVTAATTSTRSPATRPAESLADSWAPRALALILQEDIEEPGPRQYVHVKDTGSRSRHGLPRAPRRTDRTIRFPRSRHGKSPRHPRGLEGTVSAGAMTRSRNATIASSGSWPARRLEAIVVHAPVNPVVSDR